MIRDYDDSAEDSYDSISTDDGDDIHHNHDAHQSGDWDISYAAADGDGDSKAMARLPLL